MIDKHYLIDGIPLESIEMLKKYSTCRILYLVTLANGTNFTRTTRR